MIYPKWHTFGIYVAIPISIIIYTCNGIIPQELFRVTITVYPDYGKVAGKIYLKFT
jgi:hypothetical protein